MRKEQQWKDESTLGGGRNKERRMERKSKVEKGGEKGKESPFGSHEILRLATDPRGNDGNRINFTGGRASMPRRLASIRSTDLEVSIFRETRNCPPGHGNLVRSLSSGSRRRRKPLTLVLGLVQFAAVPRLFRSSREPSPPSQRNARFRVSRNTVQTEETVNCSEIVRVTRYSRCSPALSALEEDVHIA